MTPDDRIVSGLSDSLGDLPTKPEPPPERASKGKHRSYVNDVIKRIGVRPMGKVAKRALRANVMALNQTGRVDSRISQRKEAQEAAAVATATMAEKRATLAGRLGTDTSRMSAEEVDILLEKGAIPTLADTIARMTPEELEHLKREFGDEKPLAS